ncbi:uncharacterized protein EV422DRAFT_504821 [Fimicolochytrium jonesii]|uniref:uncharacterized protein n=1 Tax=Fimicolochytrium jonesii TaxID=1396493 RepID=UPI0022FE1E8F|nr:uncharacterized protein EV422DRAFT_504821 [Fimicolochytrium jonesii]KAI8823649.1 hypothetical protein EV422DRAFT_504821 [Fimicolochytrium jonesii]
MCEQLSSSAIETFRESAASILKNENTLDRLGELATVLREIRAKRIEMENLKPNSDVKWRGVSSWRSLVSRTPSPSSSRHGSRSASPGPKSSGGYAEKDALQSDIHRLKEDARLRIRGLPEDLRHSIVMAEYENVDEADPGQCAGIDAICSDLRDSINQAYFNAFDPLPFGLFSEEDELRMRWQDSTAALLKVHEAGPMLQQATTALECIMSSAHDGQNSKMAGQGQY